LNAGGQFEIFFQAAPLCGGEMVKAETDQWVGE
jgi:hypothetical protein